MIISLYRRKPCFKATENDSVFLLKEVGCFPYHRKDQFYITDMVRGYTKAKPGSAAYKIAYRKASNRLQYLKKLGKVVNSRYGLWSWVKLSY